MTVLSWLVVLDRTFKLPSLDYILDLVTICGNLVPTNNIVHNFSYKTLENVHTKIRYALKVEASRMLQMLYLISNTN